MSWPAHWYVTSDSVEYVDDLMVLPDEPVLLQFRWLTPPPNAECAISVPAYGVHAVVWADGGEILFQPNGMTPALMRIDGPSCPLSVQFKIEPQLRERYFAAVSERINGPGHTVQPLPPYARGYRTYLSKCEECHSVAQSPTASGPAFSGLYGSTAELSDGTSRVVDEQFIRWVLDRAEGAPHDKLYQCPMPSFHGRPT